MHSLATGDVAPLREICDIAEQHNAFVFIDECHATGFFGKRLPKLQA